MERLSAFASFTVTHVRREKNRRADELANKAIDNREK
jgi:ribonuclease HI